MNRPEVRIIQNQEIETKQVQVSQSEADALLAKYGYKEPTTFSAEPTKPSTSDLTFEEMVRIHEQEQEQKRQRAERLRNGGKPVSFDQYNMNYSSTKYTSIDDDNSLGIKIQIVSDMKIPK